ncbi:MAG: hypothetical protein ACOCXG_02915 [Nanoarchaeota archaeon]
MYICNSMLEGLKILGFDKKAIREASTEKKLEDIFLSNIFVNYFIVMIVYLAGLLSGGFSLGGRELNMPIIYALLMIYPLAFNLVVYGVYGFFGLFAEMLDKKKTIKPLLSVGFHASIVYTILFAVIGAFALINPSYGLFLGIAFDIYFIFAMFKIISVVYGFSHNKTVMVVMVPLLFIAIIALLVALIFPEFLNSIISGFY